MPISMQNIEMAVPLLFIMKEAGQFRLVFNDEARTTLSHTFKDYSNVLPFLFLSDTNLSPLLADLIHKGQADNGFSDEQIARFIEKTEVKINFALGLILFRLLNAAYFCYMWLMTLITTTAKMTKK